MQTSYFFFFFFFFNSSVIIWFVYSRLKMKLESLECFSDSASVKDLSCRPKDMTVIYTSMDVMTASHIPQTLLRQYTPFARGDLRER